MRFTKMHGIGNDYVYINGFDEPLPEDGAALAELARRISDRHFGVGGDGLILVLPPTPAVAANGQAHVRMRMFNADGSEGEMCGNGIRCVCKLAFDQQVSPDIRDARPMRIETGRGVLSLDYTLGTDGLVQGVTVDMGQPILDLPAIPVDAGKLDDTLHDATFVSMGNPHAVLFVDDLADQHLTLGPVLEKHPAFPRRINVHFVKVHRRDEVTVTHWERGSGATLACGTGACAVCVAGVLTQRTNPAITAHLPGGDLQLHWRQSATPNAGHVFMTGPATEVFRGEWTP